MGRIVIFWDKRITGNASGAYQNSVCFVAIREFHFRYLKFKMIAKGVPFLGRNMFYIYDKCPVCSHKNGMAASCCSIFPMELRMTFFRI